MIKKRKCTYPDCETEQIMLIKKMCNYHYYKSKPKKTYTYKRKYKPITPIKKEKNKKLKDFFNYHLSILSNQVTFCDNCGCKLNGGIANIAHIFPKRNSAHPEIMDNILNYMYLCCSLYGENGCHELFDRVQTTDKIYTLNCFNIAYKRYKIIVDNIGDLKYSKYTKYFIEYDKE